MSFARVPTARVVAGGIESTDSEVATALLHTRAPYSFFCWALTSSKYDSRNFLRHYSAAMSRARRLLGRRGRSAGGLAQFEGKSKHKSTSSSRRKIREIQIHYMNDIKRYMPLDSRRWRHLRHLGSFPPPQFGLHLRNPAFNFEWNQLQPKTF